MTRAERLALFALKTANERATPGSSLITAIVEMADKLVADPKIKAQWETFPKKKKAEKLVDFLLAYDMPEEAK